MRCAYCNRRGSSMRNALCWPCMDDLGGYPPGSVGDAWYQAYLKLERMGKALPWGFRYLWGRQVRAMVRAKRASDDRMHRAQVGFLSKLLDRDVTIPRATALPVCDYCQGHGCPECMPMGAGDSLI